MQCKPHICCLCGSSDYRLEGDFSKAAPRETDFGMTDFKRQIFHCLNCDVYFNDFDYPFDYQDDYNSATYSNNLQQVYDKIMSLPPDKSDNVQRVKRIIDFTRNYGFDENMRILDVGAGLSVFAGKLIENSYKNCAVIDPSPLSAQHALEYVGVSRALNGELKDWDKNDKVDLICFNKVLEHIKYPVEVLKQAIDCLSDKDMIYIELPDGENALKNGTAWEREEFFAGHYTAFTSLSLNYLVDNAGLDIIDYASIHEPSDKYTIYAFLTRK